MSRAKAKLLEIAGQHEELPILPNVPDRHFAVPPSGPAQVVFLEAQPKRNQTELISDLVTQHEQEKNLRNAYVYV